MSLGLNCNAVQAVHRENWQVSHRPIGATANVTGVFDGTPWIDDTLPARQIALNREAETQVRLPGHARGREPLVQQASGGFA